MRFSPAASALVLCLGGTWTSGPLYAGPPEDVEAPSGHCEKPHDLWLPTPPQPEGGGPEGDSGASVQVNVNAAGANIVGDAANEPSIAIDPTNPNRIVIGWRQFDNVASDFRQAGYAYSTDGGQTWTFPGVLQPGIFRSDPVLACDNFGRFFYASLKSNFEVDIWRSLDGGVTWPSFTPAFGGDKEWMVVDRTGGVGNGNIYMAWTGANQFTRSTDGGDTFMSPIGCPINNTFWGTMDVASNGDLYLVDPFFQVVRSSNAQNPAVAPTFQILATVNLGGGFVDNVGPNPDGLVAQPWIAVDRSGSASNGNIYLLCSVDPPGPDPLDVRFSRGTNGGTTWSPSVRINDDSITVPAWQWFGTMSVAPNGRIDVIWNDTRDQPSLALSRVYYAYSLDQGTTWSANLPLTPAWNSLIGWPNQNKIGDYYQMISDEYGAALAYAATFNGEQDVYFLRVFPDCNNNGMSDVQDIAAGTSQDCNLNSNPDECESAADCNNNNIQDICEPGGVADCDSDGITNFCELAGGVPDCNENGLPDNCDPDCDGDGIPDACEIDVGAPDCNANSIPDVCEMVNRALQFDGNSDFANAGTSPVLGLTNGLTIEAWVRPNSTTGFGVIVSKGSGSTTGYGFIQQNGKLDFVAYGSQDFFTVGTYLTVGVWKHVAVVFDTSNDAHYYVNGQFVETRLGTAAAGVSPNPLLIGRTSLTGAEYWNGAIDEVRIWSVVRTAQQIADSFDARLVGNEAGLVGYWRMDDGGGQLAIDSAPNGNHAALGTTPQPDAADPVWIQSGSPILGGDCNDNGIPDVCESPPIVCEPCLSCPGDLDGGNSVNGLDITLFVACLLNSAPLGSACSCADMNVDEILTAVDVTVFVNRLLLGACP